MLPFGSILVALCYQIYELCGGERRYKSYNKMYSIKFLKKFKNLQKIRPFLNIHFKRTMFI